MALRPQNGRARLPYVRDLQSRLRAQRADDSRLHAQRAQGFSSSTAQLHDVLGDTHGFRVFVAFVLYAPSLRLQRCPYSKQRKCVCVYVCIYLSLSLYIYIYIYITYLYMSISLHIYVYMYICIYHISLSMYVCIYIYIYIYIQRFREDGKPYEAPVWQDERAPQQPLSRLGENIK